MTVALADAVLIEGLVDAADWMKQSLDISNAVDNVEDSEKVAEVVAISLVGKVGVEVEVVSVAEAESVVGAEIGSDFGETEVVRLGPLA